MGPRAHARAAATPGWNRRRAAVEHSIAERSRGALRLWIRMIIIVAIQLVILAGALVIQALAL